MCMSVKKHTTCNLSEPTADKHICYQFDCCNRHYDQQWSIRFVTIDYLNCSWTIDGTVYFVWRRKCEMRDFDKWLKLRQLPGDCHAILWWCLVSCMVDVCFLEYILRHWLFPKLPGIMWSNMHCLRLAISQQLIIRLISLVNADGRNIDIHRWCSLGNINSAAICLSVCVCLCVCKNKQRMRRQNHTVIRLRDMADQSTLFCLEIETWRNNQSIIILIRYLCSEHKVVCSNYKIECKEKMYSAHRK